MGTALALYYSHLTDPDKVFDDIDWGGGASEDDSPDISEAFSGEKIINIAFLGHDNNAARSQQRVKGYTGLVDTIMVAAINLDTAKVNLVSIPRDSLVPIYGYDSFKDKINHANYWGWSKDKGLPMEDRVAAGITTQVETISSILGGVPIHFYVAMDLDAVEELVDLIGGVSYDVPKDIYSRRGQLLVEKGYQKLNGRKFMYYVRDRKGSSDAIRAGNQQDILIAGLNQFKKTKTLLHAPTILLKMKNEVRTNLSLEQIMALALFASQEVSSSDISTHVLEGRYESGGIPGRRDQKLPYYLLDHPKRAKLIEEIWGIVVEPGPPDKVLPVEKKDPPKSEGEGDDYPSDP